MSAEQLRNERERREAQAVERARSLPPGDYHAYDHTVRDRDLNVIAECDSHWDACLLMMALSRKRDTQSAERCPATNPGDQT